MGALVGLALAVPAPRLSPRLDRLRGAVLDLAPTGDHPLRVADIGCDHGLLPLSLWRSRSHTRAIGVDVAAKALNRARRNAQEAYGASSFYRDGDKYIDGNRVLEWRLGDGLHAIADRGEVDTIVVSGVGPRSAFHVLCGATDPPGELLRRKGVKHVVLQPAANPRPTAVRPLREALAAAGMGAVREACDYVSSRYYVTLVYSASVPTKPASSARDLLIGALDPSRGPAREYLARSAAWLEGDLAHAREWGVHRWGRAEYSVEGSGAPSGKEHKLALASEKGSSSAGARYQETISGSDLCIIRQCLDESPMAIAPGRLML